MTSQKHSESMPGAQPETASGRGPDLRFAQIPARAIRHPDISAGEFRILAAIALHCAGERGGWPKQQTIADFLGVSRETVSRAVKSLKAAGVLEVVSRFRKTGAQRENVYYVPTDAKIRPQDLVEDDEDDTPPAPPPVTGSSHPPCDEVVTPPVIAGAIATKDEQTKGTYPPSPHGGDEIEKAFDQIWKLWPDQGRKHSPGRAIILRALEKHGEGIPLDDMIAAVRGFVRSSDPKFAPSLSKWLRERKFEAWLPKPDVNATGPGASAFSTAQAVPLPEKAAKCLDALKARYGHTTVATWFRSATWDDHEVRFPTTFERDRVEAAFGGVLYEYGFSAVEGSAAA